MLSLQNALPHHLQCLLTHLSSVVSLRIWRELLCDCLQGIEPSICWSSAQEQLGAL